MNSFFKNKANIYFLLWCLYLLKGTLYTEGTLINQGLMFLVLLWTMVEAVRCIQTRKKHSVSPFFTALSILLVMFTVYGIALIVSVGLSLGGRPSYYYLESAYVSLLPIYVTYLYTNKGLITIKSLQIWMVVFLIVGICEFYKLQRELLEQLFEVRSAYDQSTNNGGYLILSLIPGLLLFRKKPIFLYIGMAVCMLFIFMSMKRGAIFSGIIAVLLIMRNTIKMSKKRQRLVFYLLAAVCIIVLVRYVEQMIATSDYFNYRLEQTLEGNSSERDIIFEDFWRLYTQQYSLLDQLIGRGAWSTIRLREYFAHNDWLELLINQGALGAILLFTFLMQFFRVSRNTSLSVESRFCLLMIFLIVSIKTFISMSICSMSIYVTSILGFALADGFRENLNLQYNGERGKDYKGGRYK